MISGVYTITAPSGSHYIGSSLNISRRWREHRRDLSGGNHCNPGLSHAAVKYGLEHLKFSVIVICRPQDMLLYEQIAMDALKPEYNLAPVAGNTLGITRSPASKAKTSATLKGRAVSAETRAKLSAALKGRRPSEETKAKMSAARRGKKIANRRPMSQETRRKIGLAHKGRPKSCAECRNISDAKMGHPVSEETRKKISDAFARKREAKT